MITDCCAGCGIEDNINLLDACRDGEDDQRLFCIACYGTTYDNTRRHVIVPWDMISPEDMKDSIAPKLAPIYRRYLEEFAR